MLFLKESIMKLILRTIYDQASDSAFQKFDVPNAYVVF